MKTNLLPGLIFLLSIGSDAAPTRIVSMNPCLDQILVAVADPQQIAALSHYSRDPRSSLILNTAKQYPSHFGSAEEVMQFKPDLVLASLYSSQSTLNILKKLKTNLSLYDLPNSIEVSDQQVIQIARLTGHPERGVILNERIHQALNRAMAQATPSPIRALVYQANGFVAGKGTLIDQVMTLSGYTNQATQYGVQQWGIVHLEDLILSPPQVLFTPATRNAWGAWSTRMIAHPVLTQLPENIMRQSVFPESLLYCAGPTLIPLAQAFRSAQSLQSVPE